LFHNNPTEIKETISPELVVEAFDLAASSTTSLPYYSSA
jgi:hypothetical protein